MQKLEVCPECKNARGGHVALKSDKFLYVKNIEQVLYWYKCTYKKCQLNGPCMTKKRGARHEWNHLQFLIPKLFEKSLRAKAGK